MAIKIPQLRWTTNYGNNVGPAVVQGGTAANNVNGTPVTMFEILSSDCPCLILTMHLRMAFNASIVVGQTRIRMIFEPGEADERNFDRPVTSASTSDPGWTNLTIDPTVGVWDSTIMHNTKFALFVDPDTANQFRMDAPRIFDIGTQDDNQTRSYLNWPIRNGFKLEIQGGVGSDSGADFSVNPIVGGAMLTRGVTP